RYIVGTVEVATGGWDERWHIGLTEPAYTIADLLIDGVTVVGLLVPLPKQAHQRLPSRRFPQPFNVAGNLDDHLCGGIRRHQPVHATLRPPDPAPVPAPRLPVVRINDVWHGIAQGDEHIGQQGAGLRTVSFRQSRQVP